MDLDNYDRGVLAFVIVMSLVAVSGWAYLGARAYSATTGAIACSDTCYPAVGKSIDDACHCATATGWTREYEGER